MYWDWCNRDVMVMERIDGIPVNAVAELERHRIDIPKLARDGVEIFFTQVFRDGFFHADMHPGNIFVAKDGRYCGVDFGIMGTLSDADKSYLAINFMAFFHRDYHKVAVAHVEAGWVPRDTRVDELESAVRSVCEPIFDRPLKEIYFGKVLMRLFEVSRRFDVQVQPQLVLLQKTLLQVEGLGRQLDPDLDLRRTAQPILERWANEQAGPGGFMRQMKRRGAALGEGDPAAAATRAPRAHRRHAAAAGSGTREARAGPAPPDVDAGRDRRDPRPDVPRLRAALALAQHREAVAHRQQRDAHALVLVHEVVELAQRHRILVVVRGIGHAPGPERVVDEDQAVRSAAASGSARSSRGTRPCPRR